VFYVPVEDRPAKTLIPIIRKYILPKAKIVGQVIIFGITAAILAVEHDIRMKAVEDQEDKHHQNIEVMNEKITNFTKEIIQLFTDFREDQKIENYEN